MLRAGTAGRAAVVAGGLAALFWGLDRWQAGRALPEVLRAKTVLITGGTRGLGLALARELARSSLHQASS